MTAQELADSFRKDHRELFDRGLIFLGIFFTPTSGFSEDEEIDMDPIPGNDVIDVMRPFIFDSRKIPDHYMGFEVSTVRSSPSDHQQDDPFDRNYLPREFVIGDDEVIYWEDADAPLRYTTFVDRCEDDLRKALGDPSMTRMDILDALAWGNFQRHCDQYRRIKHERKTGKGLPPNDEIQVGIMAARGRNVV